MKKLMICLLSLIILTACNSVDANVEERFSQYDDYLSITTDYETGCQYIIFDGYKQGGITPLLGVDGLPICVIK